MSPEATLEVDADASGQQASIPPDIAPLRLLLVSDECFVCEALAAFLECDPSVSAVRRADVAEIIALGLNAEADAALVCVLQESPAAVPRLRRAAPNVPVIACALREEEETVIAWAEAGVSGYLASTTPLAEFVATLRRIMGGEQCSAPRIVAALLNRCAAAPHLGGTPTPPHYPLTRRERQIAELIAADRSDKEIARLLNISVATTKFHVHNLLRKLNAPHRKQAIDTLREAGGIPQPSRS